MNLIIIQSDRFPIKNNMIKQYQILKLKHSTHDFQTQFKLQTKLVNPNKLSIMYIKLKYNDLKIINLI